MTQAATLAQLASSGALSADTSGNVGIGTTTPATKLQVNGTANGNVATLIGNASLTGSAPTNTGSIRLIDNPTASTAAGGFEFLTSTFGSGYGWKIASIDSSGVQLTFSTRQNSASWTESMRLNPDGNLLVGTTSSTNSAKVTAVSSSTSSAYQMMMNNTDTGTGNQISMDIYRNSTRVGYITTTNTTTSFTSISDYRLKKDVVPMTNALAAVAQLKPCRYKWKVDGSDGQGFIAHELQAVVPDCVFGEKDEVNEDGSIKPQGIDTSFLVATLTAAIQELKAELDVCKAEIAALKGV